MVDFRERHKRYYGRVRNGDLPLTDDSRIVAQAIADGANSVRDVVRVTSMKLTKAHRVVLGLRGHGVILPPPDVPVRGGLTIAPGYVVHRNEIYQLMKVGI